MTASPFALSSNSDLMELKPKHTAASNAYIIKIVQECDFLSGISMQNKLHIKVELSAATPKSYKPNINWAEYDT